MIEKTVKTRVVQKHDIEKNWVKAVNFVPKSGELIIYDEDDKYSFKRIKIGDGKTSVSSLPFYGGGNIPKIMVVYEECDSAAYDILLPMIEVSDVKVTVGVSYLGSLFSGPYRFDTFTRLMELGWDWALSCNVNDIDSALMALAEYGLFNPLSYLSETLVTDEMKSMLKAKGFRIATNRNEEVCGSYSKNTTVLDSITVDNSTDIEELFEIMNDAITSSRSVCLIIPRATLIVPNQLPKLFAWISDRVRLGLCESCTLSEFYQSWEPVDYQILSSTRNEKSINWKLQQGFSSILEQLLNGVTLSGGTLGDISNYRFMTLAGGTLGEDL